MKLEEIWDFVKLRWPPSFPRGSTDNSDNGHSDLKQLQGWPYPHCSVPSGFRKQTTKAVLRCYRNKTSLLSGQISVWSSHLFIRQVKFCLVLDCLRVMSHLKSIITLSSCHFSVICYLDLQSFIIKRSQRTCRQHLDKFQANQCSFLVSHPATCSASPTQTLPSITYLLGH